MQDKGMNRMEADSRMAIIPLNKLSLRDFNDLIGHDSYVRCQGKKRIAVPLLDVDSAQSHINRGGAIGWWVRSGYIVIDIDEGPGQAEAVLKKLGMKTLMARTPRGLHLYFKTDKEIPHGTGMVLPCGLKCDTRCANKGYVILPFGQEERAFNKCREIAELPLELTPMTGCKESLLGLKDHDGRNDALLRQLSAYKKRGASNVQIAKMAEYINEAIFADSLPKNELKTVIDSVSKHEVINGERPQELVTISARDLQVQVLPPLAFAVDEILPQGLALLAAPSKYGKSWLSLDLCLTVASGGTFLGYQTHKAGTLYLALEDSYRRLKGRMETILQGDTAPDNFYLATAANTIDNGLTEQIAGHLKEHPNTKLIVIDVLERVRSSSGRNSNAYALDYQNMGALKAIADTNNLSVLVIHHTRKGKDETDVYNMISGTNGIMGASDTVWVMQREKRDDTKTILHLTGRDIEQQSLVVEMNKCKWRRISTVEEAAANTALNEYRSNPVVKTIEMLFVDHPDGFELTSNDLLSEMKKLSVHSGYSARTLGKCLNKLADNLYQYDRIIHSAPRVDHKRMHRFQKEVPSGLLGASGSSNRQGHQPYRKVRDRTYEIDFDD